ncbi:hypothetical protein FB451DRAFT_1413655 [Mycena latifolia]|nr:hypothetical protein FB451DRAFT_1413655 [Mycena latifolia]
MFRTRITGLASVRTYRMNTPERRRRGAVHMMWQLDLHASRERGHSLQVSTKLYLSTTTVVLPSQCNSLPSDAHVNLIRLLGVPRASLVRSSAYLASSAMLTRIPAPTASPRDPPDASGIFVRYLAGPRTDATAHAPAAGRGMTRTSDAKLYSRRAPPSFPLAAPLCWVLEFREEVEESRRVISDSHCAIASQDGILQPCARTTTRRIPAPSAMNSTDYLEPFLELMPLHIAVIVASWNREVVSVEWGGDGDHDGATTRGAVRTGRCRVDHRVGVGVGVGVGRDSRGGAMHTRVRSKARLALTHKARERAVDASRPPTRRATIRPGMPRAQERPASPRGGVRVARGVGAGVPAKPLRLVATKTSAPSGGGIRAVCARAGEESRMHASAGSAAWAPRAEAALPTDSHSGGSGGASCARSPSSPAAASWPSRVYLLPLTYVVPHSLQTTREPI